MLKFKFEKEALRKMTEELASAKHILDTMDSNDDIASYIKKIDAFHRHLSNRQDAYIGMLETYIKIDAVIMAVMAVPTGVCLGMMIGKLFRR